MLLLPVTSYNQEALRPTKAFKNVTVLALLSHNRNMRLRLNFEWISGLVWIFSKPVHQSLSTKLSVNKSAIAQSLISSKILPLDLVAESPLNISLSRTGSLNSFHVTYNYPGDHVHVHFSMFIFVHVHFSETCNLCPTFSYELHTHTRTHTLLMVIVIGFKVMWYCAAESPCDEGLHYGGEKKEFLFLSSYLASQAKWYVHMQCMEVRLASSLMFLALVPIDAIN